MFAFSIDYPLSRAWDVSESGSYVYIVINDENVDVDSIDTRTKYEISHDTKVVFTIYECSNTHVVQGKLT